MVHCFLCSSGHECGEDEVERHGKPRERRATAATTTTTEPTTRSKLSQRLDPGRFRSDWRREVVGLTSDFGFSGVQRSVRNVFDECPE